MARPRHFALGCGLWAASIGPARAFAPPATRGVLRDAGLELRERNRASFRGTGVFVGRLPATNLDEDDDDEVVFGEAAAKPSARVPGKPRVKGGQVLSIGDGTEDQDEDEPEDMGMGVSNIQQQRSRQKKRSGDGAAPAPRWDQVSWGSDVSEETPSWYSDIGGPTGGSGDEDVGVSTNFAKKAVDYGEAPQETLNAILGGDEVRDMDMARQKGSKRAAMKARGLSDEQIAAYVGDPVEEVTRAPDKTDLMLDALAEAATREQREYESYIKGLGKVPSHSMVEVDEGGQPVDIDRFVYVDEYTCIGCTHCAHTAPSTFFMEDDHGRARVFQQAGDPAVTIMTAIETCPVDCIHYVGFDELARLEREREGININFKARLVGNDHDTIANGQQVISGNESMRCANCPTRGCYNCPMYSVGYNPAYQERKAEIEAKKLAKGLAKRAEEQGNRSVEL